MGFNTSDDVPSGRGLEYKSRATLTRTLLLLPTMIHRHNLGGDAPFCPTVQFLRVRRKRLAPWSGPEDFVNTQNTQSTCISLLTDRLRYK